jgi:N-acetylneuraminate synthase
MQVVKTRDDMRLVNGKILNKVTKRLSYALTERAWQALGKVSYGATEAEKKSIMFRRSLYVVQDIKAGEALTNENIRAIRPGLGLPTKYLPQIINRVAKQDLKRGTALSWDLI